MGCVLHTCLSASLQCVYTDMSICACSQMDVHTGVALATVALATARPANSQRASHAAQGVTKMRLALTHASHAKRGDTAQVGHRLCCFARAVHTTGRRMQPQRLTARTAQSARCAKLAAASQGCVGMAHMQQRQAAAVASCARAVERASGRPAPAYPRPTAPVLW